MKRIMVFGLFFFSLSSFAKFRQLYLYEHDMEIKESKVSDPARLIRNRAYLVFSKVNDAWNFVLSNERGTLDSPTELVGAGTILDGSFIGAAHPIKRYLLTEKGVWVPTPDEEQIVLFTEDAPHNLKLVSFKPVADRLVRISR